MSFHLLFGNLTEFDLLPIIIDREILPILQYSFKVFQLLISLGGHKESYSPVSHVDTYNDDFMFQYFNLANIYL